MPKKVLIALPPAMLEQADYVARCEHRTRSDLIREALRRYLDNFKRAQSAQLSQGSQYNQTSQVPQGTPHTSHAPQGTQQVPMRPQAPQGSPLTQGSQIPPRPSVSQPSQVRVGAGDSGNRFTSTIS